VGFDITVLLPSLVSIYVLQVLPFLSVISSRRLLGYAFPSIHHRAAHLLTHLLFCSLFETK